MQTDTSDNDRDERQEDSTPKQRNNALRTLVFVVVLAAAFLLIRTLNLQLYLTDAKQWILSFGVFSPLLFIGAYILAVILMIPGLPVTMAAGAMFGPVYGTVYVSIASTVGVALAFLISRYVARDAVAAMISGNQKFENLDKLTQRYGAGLVALTRLIPVFPFNLLNYGFGLTDIRFLNFVAISWICMLPGTAVYVMAGHTAYQGATSGEVPWNTIGMLVVAVGLLTALIYGIKRKFDIQSLQNQTEPLQTKPSLTEPSLTEPSGPTS